MPHRLVAYVTVRAGAVRKYRPQGLTQDTGSLCLQGFLEYRDSTVWHCTTQSSGLKMRSFGGALLSASYASSNKLLYPSVPQFS